MKSYLPQSQLPRLMAAFSGMCLLTLVVNTANEVLILAIATYFNG